MEIPADIQTVIQTTFPEGASAEPMAGDAGEAGLMDEIKAQLCQAADPLMLDCVLLPPSKARVAMMLELLRSS